MVLFLESGTKIGFAGQYLMLRRARSTTVIPETYHGPHLSWGSLDISLVHSGNPWKVTFSTA